MALLLSGWRPWLYWVGGHRSQDGGHSSIGLEDIALRMEAIAIGLEDIALRMEAIALLGWRT